MGLVGLDGWTVHRSAPPLLPPGDWDWSDGEGTHTRVLPGARQRILIRNEILGSALVDLQDCSVLLHDIGADPGLAEHWITDQVAPRILSHLGDLVVHAGGSVTPGGRAFLIVAPSQHGKSTLTAFLHQGGWPLMGDDAVVIRPESEDVTVRSVYRRLKLRRDSWRHLYPEAEAEPPPGWKAFVDLGEDGPFGEDAEHPLGGIFFLARPDGSSECRVERLSPAQTCLELVRNSFALDPTDRGRAARRMAVAGAVTNQVPGFRLHYPRDYGRLPEVRDAIRAALAA